MRLTETDYTILESSWINRDLAQAAELSRLSDIEGRERMGRTGSSSGDCSGMRFPYRWPGEVPIIAERLRVDHPPIDFASRKALNKYLSPPGQRNRIYFPLADPAWLADITMDIVISEGEKKGLALHRAAIEGPALLNGNGGSSKRALFMALTFPGVWSWRGQVGIATNSKGVRVPEKGVIPDMDRIVWKGRRVTIVFDSNTATNDKVRAARSALARELESRGARVYIVDLPIVAGVNGVDDYLFVSGLAPFLNLLQHAARYDWHDELAITAKGKILASFGNALTALRLAPAWQGVLGFNEFSLSIDARKATPWGGPAGRWSDDSDLRTMEWLERNGIPIGHRATAEAVETVAREQAFHPLIEYLDGLKWDGVERIDTWLAVYLGAEDSSYTRAIGKCWLVSGIARARKPGCKADHAMIFESPQGAGKSTTFEILGGEFYSDDLADLGSKDAAMGCAGVWIVELAELDAMGRAEVSKIKAFISRHDDRFRPPYGHHIIESPRQCIFGGSVNRKDYLKDETGGRRFWPVQCGEIRLTALRRDRDQLWAEAAERYRKGETWWLDDPKLIGEASEEQEIRYAADPWEGLIEPWLRNAWLNGQEVTTARILGDLIRKETGQWGRADEIRVGAILHRLGWEVARRTKEKDGTRKRVYAPKPKPPEDPE